MPNSTGITTVPLSVIPNTTDIFTIPLILSSTSAYRYINTLTPMALEKTRDTGQQIVYAGEDFRFSFYPAYSAGGWDFVVTLHREELGAEVLATIEASGSLIESALDGEETAALLSGDYILVCRMTNGATTDIDVLRFHVGLIG